MKKRFLTISFLLTFLLFESFSSWLSPASGQNIRIVGQNPADSEEENGNVQKQTIFPAPPREFRRAMEDAKKLMGMERYAEAVRQLDQILGSDEDFFYMAETSSDGSAEVFRNLKQEAEQILETLPPKGLELYEVEFGTAARLLLNDGLEQGKMELVAQAANRFFFTKAGSEAAFLQGLDLLDRQNPAAAREIFLKLRANPRLSNRFEPILTLYLAAADFAVGRGDEAVQILEEGKKSRAAAWNALKIGGKPLAEAVPNGASAQEFAAWLKSQVPVLAGGLPEETSRDWTLLLQNQARCTDTGNFSMPILTPCWRVSMIDDPEGTVILALLAHGNSILPLHSPLVVGNTALMRTAWNLTAIDLQTGKKLWTVPTMDYEGVRDRLNRLEPSQKGAVQGLTPDVAAHQLMAGLLKHQIYGEEAFATLASDGKLVFCVEDSIQRFLPTPDSLMKQRFNPQIQVQPLQLRAGQAIPIQGRIQIQGGGNIQIQGGGIIAPDDPLDVTDRNTVPNRLACYNIQTGKLVWHVGGQTLAQSGTMFLGAPLCVGETLYVLGQRSGTVQLLALESQTGKLIWSQLLCLSSYDPGPSPISCTPRLTNGMIVCPTPSGALIGVNSVTHALIWGNVCGKTLEMNRRQVFDTRAASMITSDFPGRHLQEIVTAEEKILYLATGLQSLCLVCIDSVTGKTLWKRENSLGYESILAVNAGEVIIKGRDRIFKVNLADGSEIGNFLIPPTSGLGFRTGNSLVFPHGDALVRYSLETLKEEARTVCHEPDRLGNLIPVGEFLLSQNAEVLEAFIQSDAADDWLKRTRQADLTSPEAIQVEAVRLWNAGKLPEAITLLKTGGDYTHDLMKRAILALAQSPASAEAIVSGTDSGFDLDDFYSQMETPEEKLHFSTQIVRSFLAAKRWSDALAWTRRTLELLKDPGAEEVLIPVTESFFTGEPENQQNQLVKNPLPTTPTQNQNPQPDRKLKQSPDAWLASTLDWFTRELPADDPMRAELKTWAEAEYAPLHKAFEELKTEKSTLEIRQKAEDLVKSISRFRLRFRFWDGIKSTESELFELLKLSRNFTLLETYIIQNASSDVQAGAELFRVYRELHEDSRAALVLRWLERKFPNEAVLDGKTAHELRLGLPEKDPIRVILEPEFTAFPVGKIEVKKVDERGKGTLKNEGESFHFGEYSGVSLLEGLTFRNFNFMQVDSHTISCEDSLGRIWFNLHSLPNSSEAQKNALKKNRVSFRVISRSGSDEFCQGSSFQHDWQMLGSTSLYAPVLRSAPEISEEYNPGNFLQMDPTVTFQEKPEPVDLGLEPYLKPIQKKLEDENLSTLTPDPFNRHWFCEWDSQGGSFVSSFKEYSLQRFGLFEGELLWKEGHQTRYVLDPAKVKKTANAEPFVEVFKCYGVLKDETGENEEIADGSEEAVPFEMAVDFEADDDSETTDDSENADSKPQSSEKKSEGDTAAKPPVDLASFVPFRVLRDLTLEELQKEVSQENQVFLKPEIFFEKIQIVDPQTGYHAGKTLLPLQRKTLAGDLVWGSIGNSHSSYLWNQKTQKFVWVVLQEPRLFKESVPYYLESWNLKNTSMGSSLCYALNWKHQLEVFNSKTGAHLVLEFPPAADLPMGRNGKPFEWNPKKVVSCGILPDENGCFTAVLSYDEYYEEPKEKAKEEPKEDSKKDSDGKSGEESGENSDEDSDAESGENLDELLEETTNYSGDGIMLNHALICRFDANGKPLWEKSLFVARSWLVEDLPVSLPVLCLLHQESSYVESASRDTTDSQVIRFYDRRNGRLVFDGKFPVDQRLSMVGDPIKGTARMSFQKFCLDFSFSSDPYNEEEKVQTDESSFWEDQLRQKEHSLEVLKNRFENYKKQIEVENTNYEKAQKTPEVEETHKKRVKAHEIQTEDYKRQIETLEKKIEELKKKVE